MAAHMLSLLTSLSVYQCIYAGEQQEEMEKQSPTMQGDLGLNRDHDVNRKDSSCDDDIQDSPYEADIGVGSAGTITSNSPAKEGSSESPFIRALSLQISFLFSGGI